MQLAGEGAQRGARRADGADGTAEECDERRDTREREALWCGDLGHVDDAASSPSVLMRPGMAASTELMSACMACGLSLSQSVANENPSSTPANTEKSAR